MSDDTYTPITQVDLEENKKHKMTADSSSTAAILEAVPVKSDAQAPAPASAPAPAPWHAAYPKPSNPEPPAVTASDILRRFNEGKMPGHEYILVDLRRNDHEVIPCP